MVRLAKQKGREGVDDSHSSITLVYKALSLNAHDS